MPGAVSTTIRGASDFTGSLTPGYFLRWNAGGTAFELAAIDMSAYAPLAGATFTGAVGVASNSASAFYVGPNGNTNPAFRVVGNVSSAATGLSVTGNAAGSGVTLTVLSSGTNESLLLRAKGTGAVNVTASASTATAISVTDTGGSNTYSGTLIDVNAAGCTSTTNWLRVSLPGGGTLTWDRDSNLTATNYSIDYLGNFKGNSIQKGTGVYTTFETARVITRTRNTTDKAWVWRGVSGQTASLLQLWGTSSTSTEREQADIDTAWYDSTDATRSADLVLRAYYTSTAKEGVRIRGTSGDAAIGFYGVTPVSRAVLATGAGASVDDVIAALQSLGLVKQS